ncbi:MAG TPA: zf-TFIIB domain-containing protein [Candidatus Paceibacterota bacterium]|nr:zf-TFIIB domain-containing protein [Candidatus Paceibacterota bacterium]
MKCPLDNTELQMTERQGIEIDYCPECRGVWLDRGELDKMIERGAAAMQPERGVAYEQKHGRHIDDHPYRKHKREGFLGDLFDF